MRIDNILKDDSLPISKKIQYIEKMIVKELNKAPDKVDLEKVHYYENLVEELGGEVCEKSDEDLAYNLVLIKNKARAAEESNVSKYIYKTKTTRTPFLKAMIAVAAVFVIIFSSFSVYALSVGGYGKAWINISSSIKEFLKSENENNTINGITLIRPDYTKRYDTIEELILGENLDILYPSELPHNIKLESIVQSFYSDGKFKILFVFDEKNISMEATNKIAFPSEFVSLNSNYTFKDIEIYIIPIDDNNYQAVFHCNDFEYIIFSTDNETIIKIIQNLKGF